ncbi:toll-like receptor 1 [Mixophyes fleayi]|uniref:toll-like receptor 1 n=1 Tax=Mixophyes fleayi TaxID=3061075 RepID=UPI003F4E4524
MSDTGSIRFNHVRTRANYSTKVSRLEKISIMTHPVGTYNGFFLSFLLIYVFLPTNSGKVCIGSQGQPDNIFPLVTELDLNHCNISSLQTCDFFQSYSNLQILDLSHNLLEELSFSVFQFNTFLQHLDISHNRLSSIQCSSLQFIRGITHINVSYNSFETMYLCKEFGSLTKLEHLGLSATSIRRYDFLNIAHQELKTVFLGIERLQEYESGSLQLLNTEKLHVNLPQKFTDSTVLLLDDFNISTTLEISQIMCRENCYNTITRLSRMVKRSRLSKLILSSITMSWYEVSQILKAVWRSSVEYMSIYRFILIKEFEYIYSDFSQGSLKSLIFENIIPLVFLFRGIHPLKIFSEMFVENFTMSDAEITHFFCPPEPSIFKFLTLTNNRITDGIFNQCDNLTTLQFLSLRNNKLEKLLIISYMTQTMTSLKHLDVSHNGLEYKESAFCNWSKSLVFLNLSRNRITDSIFNCLPANLEILDLSSNQLQRVSKEIEKLKALKELNLSLNYLTNIPDCGHINKNLIFLNIEDNLIYSPESNVLHNCKHVNKISIGNNKFWCDCDLRAFASTARILHERLVGWPESYKCELPEKLTGIMLKDFHPAEISCNVYILVGIIMGTMVVLLLLMCFLCKYFDLPWYLRMIFKWFRSKYRVRNINAEVLMGKRFHAFISYSQEDCDWVKQFLIPNLSKGDGSIKICHHERHFIPGKSIIENIISCIESSFKSIFVLSPNFVQSEWCHYELYFAQHSLFGKHSDNLILIVLDPIPQYLIPNKYKKLKAIMKHRTYMEWPKEKSKQFMFWANLREIIKIDFPVEEEEISYFNVALQEAT